MLREVVQKILDGWQSARSQEFSGHPIGKAIREDFTSIIKDIVHSQHPEYKIKASAGAGNWANVPWLSIINPEVTETTQDGFYPVYLFRADASGVYLALVQGTTKPQERLGKKSLENEQSHLQTNFARKKLDCFSGESVK